MKTSYLYPYIAGLFDGEGHIGIQKTTMRVVITNADGDALKSIAARCGLGYVKRVKGARRGNRIPSWQWLCFDRQELFALLEGIAPFVVIKARQMKYALDAMRCIRSCSMRDPISRDRVRWCGEMIKSFNARKRHLPLPPLSGPCASTSAGRKTKRRLPFPPSSGPRLIKPAGWMKKRRRPLPPSSGPDFDLWSLL